MPNYKLVESWGKPNDRDREWLAQTEDDKTILLINEDLRFGDKIQVVDPPKHYIVGKDGVAYDADEDEGGSTVRLQSKSVTITENGENTITYDNGYDGLSSVGIDVNVETSLQTKSVTYSSNGEHIVTYDSDYDGLSSVNIGVNVQPPLQEKNVVYTTTSTTDIVADDGYYGLSKVNIQPALQSKSVACTTNQTRTIIPDTGYAGLQRVDIVVDVPGGGGVVPATPSDAILFYSPEAFKVGTNGNRAIWNGTMYYSTDYTTWNVWDGTAPLTAAQDYGYYKLYLRGAGNTFVHRYSSGYGEAGFNISGALIRCCGNLNNLLDYDGAPILADYAFAGLFCRIGNVAFDVTLPATTLAAYCYYNMFSGCTSLTTAPALPATTLAAYCYYNMFGGCTSLTTAPAMAPTTLADYCCQSMFSGCAALTNINNLSLPATTLVRYCYYHMFYGCTSLTTAPSMAPTTVADNCCYSMFDGCTALTNINNLSLPATTLAVSCYYYMFRGCTSLTVAPALPATTLENSCYRYMFYGCTSLTTAPSVLPAVACDAWCYDDMFSRCTSLTVAPTILATTTVTGSLQYMFSGCTSLNTIPALYITTIGTDGLRGMFSGCTSIKLSIQQTGDYTNEYRIPISGTGSKGDNALLDMFNNTGGTFRGTPSINTTYYTSNTVISAN